MNQKYPHEDGIHEQTVHMVSEPSVFGPEEHTPNAPGNTDPRIQEFQEVVGGRWDDNRAVVRSYIQNLARRKDGKALILLTKALRSGAPFTQSLVCETLARMGGQAIRVLATHLFREDGTIHPDAFRALRLIGSRGCEVLLQILEDESAGELSPRQRAVLVGLLGDYPSAKTSIFLVKRLASEDRGIREAAHEALRKHGKAAERALVDLLRGRHSSAKAAKSAVYLLGLLKSQKAAPHLMVMFAREKNPTMMMMEAWALGEIGAGESLHLLLSEVESQRHAWPVVKALIQSIGKLGNVEAIAVLEPYLSNRDLRESVLEALGEIADPAAIPLVSPYLRSHVGFLRGLAVAALVRIGTKESIRMATVGFNDPDAHVQRQTEEAFLKVYTPGQVEQILAYKAEEEQRLQRKGAWKAAIQRSLGQEDAATDERNSASPEITEDFGVSEAYADATLGDSASASAGNAWNVPGPFGSNLRW